MLTLRARKILLKQLLDLQKTLDDLSIPLTTELVLGKALGRVQIVVDGFSASLTALIEDFNSELIEEEMRSRMVNFKPRQHLPTPPPSIRSDDPDDDQLMEGM